MMKKYVYFLLMTFLLVSCSEKETVREEVRPIIIEKEVTKEEKDKEQDLLETENRCETKDQVISREEIENICKQASNSQGQKDPIVVQCPEPTIVEKIVEVEKQCENNDASALANYEQELIDLDEKEIVLFEKFKCKFYLKGRLVDTGRKDLGLNCPREVKPEKLRDIYLATKDYVQSSVELLDKEDLSKREKNLIKEKSDHMKNYESFIFTKIKKLLKNYERSLVKLAQETTTTSTKNRCLYMKNQILKLFPLLGNQSEILWSDLESGFQGCLKD